MKQNHTRVFFIETAFLTLFVLLALTVLLASASSIRSILSLKPAEVLHGR